MALPSLNTLNYQHLLYFWVVAREGSIARATVVLNLTQPTISTQLRTLERALGATLFERRGRGMALTETGQMVLRYADDMFRTGRELTEALQRGRTDAPARLVVGISDSLPKLTTWRLLKPALSITPRPRTVTSGFDRSLSTGRSKKFSVPLPPQPAVHFRKLNRRTLYGQLFEQ